MVCVCVYFCSEHIYLIFSAPMYFWLFTVWQFYNTIIAFTCMIVLSLHSVFLVHTYIHIYTEYITHFTYMILVSASWTWLTPISMASTRGQTPLLTLRTLRCRMPRRRGFRFDVENLWWEGSLVNGSWWSNHHQIAAFLELWDTVVVSILLFSVNMALFELLLFLGAVVDWSWPKVGWNCRGETNTIQQTYRVFDSNGNRWLNV